MSFNHQTYNKFFTPRTPEGNERFRIAAEQYGVRVIEADVVEGETYWKVVGVHHLLPEENLSKQNIFLEALDESGRRIPSPFAWAGWSWEGQQSHERSDPAHLDKPLNEPAGNIAVFPPQKVSVWIKGLSQVGQDKSDRVENLHTMHGDERGAGGEIWNSFGHHSFYIIFQRVRKGADVKGVISGQIVNGDGYKVRLWQGNRMVTEQTVDQQQSYRFDAVPAGTYRLEAIGPSLSQDNLNIDTDHREVMVDLVAA